MSVPESYIDVADFRVRTIMPGEDVDDLERSYPGFLASRLKIATSRINARLAKLYAVPFASPTPEIVVGWLVAIVTVEAYQKRGWNPADEQSQQILESATTALAEVKEAADSEVGLFDLPLRQTDQGSSARAKAGPLGYSEQGPYDWTDRQAEAMRGR